MHRRMILWILGPLLMSGCSESLTREELLQNPYRNPVIQRDYQHWVSNRSTVLMLGRKKGTTPEEKAKKYQDYMADYNYRQTFIKNEDYSLKKLRQIAKYCNSVTDCYIAQLNLLEAQQ